MEEAMHSERGPCHAELDWARRLHRCGRRRWRRSCWYAKGEWPLAPMAKPMPSRAPQRAGLQALLLLTASPAGSSQTSQGVHPGCKVWPLRHADSNRGYIPTSFHDCFVDQPRGEGWGSLADVKRGGTVNQAVKDEDELAKMRLCDGDGWDRMHHTNYRFYNKGATGNFWFQDLREWDRSRMTLKRLDGGGGASGSGGPPAAHAWLFDGTYDLTCGDSVWRDEGNEYSQKRILVDALGQPKRKRINGVPQWVYLSCRREPVGETWCLHADLSPDPCFGPSQPAIKRWLCESEVCDMLDSQTTWCEFLSSYLHAFQPADTLHPVFLLNRRRQPRNRGPFYRGSLLRDERRRQTEGEEEDEEEG